MSFMSSDGDCTCKINRDMRQPEQLTPSKRPIDLQATTVQSVDSGCGCGDPKVILKGALMVLGFMLILFAPRMFRGTRSYFRARKDLRLRAAESYAMARIRDKSLRSYRGDR